MCVNMLEEKKSNFELTRNMQELFSLMTQSYDHKKLPALLSSNAILDEQKHGIFSSFIAKSCDKK